MGAALYDLKSITLTLGGFQIEGFAENEAIRFEWADDAARVTHTADGAMVVSRSTIDTLFVTLSVMNTSDSYRELAAQVYEQHGFGLPRELRPNQIGPNPFQMIDGPIGDFCNSRHAVYLNRPNLDKSSNAGMTQFRLALNKPRFQFGLNTAFNTV
ncbi:MAG: hypothetical protein AAGA48_27595 [Myxococcota bacterium]